MGRCTRDPFRTARQQRKLHCARFIASIAIYEPALRLIDVFLDVGSSNTQQ